MEVADTIEDSNKHNTTQMYMYMCVVTNVGTYVYCLGTRAYDVATHTNVHVHVYIHLNMCT